MTDWKTHTPEYDGHAPDDWDGKDVEVLKLEDEWVSIGHIPQWKYYIKYRYRAKQPDLLAQCLALPQADRDALIAELQKPVRDWADDVWDAVNAAYLSGNLAALARHTAATAVIRSMCRPKGECA